MCAKPPVGRFGNQLTGGILPGLWKLRYANDRNNPNAWKPGSPSVLLCWSWHVLARVQVFLGPGIVWFVTLVTFRRLVKMVWFVGQRSDVRWFGTQWVVRELLYMLGYEIWYGLIWSDMIGYPDHVCMKLLSYIVLLWYDIRLWTAYYHSGSKPHYIIVYYPSDSTWPANPPVGGHLTRQTLTKTIAKRSHRIGRILYLLYTIWTKEGPLTYYSITVLDYSGRSIGQNMQVPRANISAAMRVALGCLFLLSSNHRHAKLCQQRSLVRPWKCVRLQKGRDQMSRKDVWCQADISHWAHMAVPQISLTWGEGEAFIEESVVRRELPSTWRPATSTDGSEY